jgi:3-hydroxybutyryl-CoA dehydrogenase
MGSLNTHSTVAVIGAGTMGNGIAHVFVQNGFAVTLMDTDQAYLDRARATISANLDRQVKKASITAGERDLALGRLSLRVGVPETLAAAIAVEAVPEDPVLKKRIFAALDRALPPSAILASNTSSISITELGAVTGRADRVIGMHFMNPVPVMKLVEIVRGLATSNETYATVKSLAESLGKTTAVAQDYPGFVSNRILMPMINEAVYCLMEGVSDAESIDTVMKLGMNHPMGPLALADFIGLDVCLAILEVLHGGLGDPKYRPCPLLRNMVRAGWLGRKTGRGFYAYEGA